MFRQFGNNVRWIITPDHATIKSQQPQLFSCPRALKDAAMASGRSIRLSLPRRFVGDLVHFAHQVPTIPVQRLFNVAALDRLRGQVQQRPSWVALFTKAYGQVAAEFAELRRCYLSFPWARL